MPVFVSRRLSGWTGFEEHFEPDVVGSLAAAGLDVQLAATAPAVLNTKLVSMLQVVGQECRLLVRQCTCFDGAAAGISMSTGALLGMAVGSLTGVHYTFEHAWICWAVEEAAST